MLFSQRRRRPTDRSGRHTGLPAAAALPATAAVVPTAAAFPSPTAVTCTLKPHGQDPARRGRTHPTAGALTAETVIMVGG